MLSATLVPEAVMYEIPGVPTPLVMSGLVWIILGGLSIAVAFRAGRIPGRIQIVLESALSYVCGMADEIIGQRNARRYYPLFVGLFMFILVGNIVGLIPGLQSPTANPSTTFGLALLVTIYYHVEGIRVHGWHYFRQFAGPSLPWYLFPVRLLVISTELLSVLIRPFSLGMRLFCNIFSKELFLSILALLFIQFMVSPERLDKWFCIAPFLLRPIILLFGVLIGIIQAVVFLVLSISYIAGAISAEDH